jgi:hypothetical protein
VPDHLIGKKIRCAACQGIVEAKQEEAIEEVPVALEPKKKKAPPPVPTGGSFDFGGSAAQGNAFAFDAPTDRLNVGVRLRMASAANMMMYGLGYAVFVSLVILVIPIMGTLTVLAHVWDRLQAEHMKPLIAGLSAVWGPVCCGYTVEFLFAVFIYLGAKSLRLVRARGMVITGAVFSILLGLQGFLGMGISGLTFLSGVGFLVAFSLIVGCLCFVQVVFCIWGGIRALMLISRPEVHDAIQAEAERVYANG